MRALAPVQDAVEAERPQDAPHLRVQVAIVQLHLLAGAPGDDLADRRWCRGGHPPKRTQRSGKPAGACSRATLRSPRLDAGAVERRPGGPGPMLRRARSIPNLSCAQPWRPGPKRGDVAVVKTRSVGACLMAVLATCLATSATALAAPSTATAPGVWAWGLNNTGQLGVGISNGPEECLQTRACSTTPLKASGLDGATAISAGQYHSLALLKNGTVLAWGENYAGELGDGGSANSDVPVPVSGLSDATAISAGSGFSLALLGNGTVMAWGSNSAGELGDGSEADSTVPVPVSGLSGVVAISAGNGHSLALLKNGTVMAWGYNFAGELGDGSNANSNVPVPVSGLSGVTAISAGAQASLALLSNGTVMEWGYFQDVPAPVSGLSGVKAVSAGARGGLALLNTGAVVRWWEASQLVPVSGLSGVTAISDSEGFSSLALLGNGTVMAWGGNKSGELGNGSDENSPDETPEPVLDLSNVTAISAGAEFDLALTGPAPAQTASVSLLGTTLQVGERGGAAIELSCMGSAPACTGTLKLTTQVTVGAGNGKRAVTVALGAISGSIPSGANTTVELHLNPAARALLRSAHGRLAATLTIVSPAPSQEQTYTVTLQ